MSIRLAVIPLAAGSLAQPALAADKLLVAKLAPEIVKACVASADGRSGSMSAAALGGAIFRSGFAPLVVQYDWLRSGGSGIGAVAVDEPTGINGKSVRRLRGLIAAWVAPGAPGSVDRLPLADGGVEIRLSDSDGATGDATPRVLTAVLEGRDDGMTIRCLPRARGGAPAGSVVANREPAETRANILVTRAPTDLTIKSLLDRPSAEIAYTNNLDRHRQTLSLTGTIGVVWREFALGDVARVDRKGGVFARMKPMAFVQIEREGSTGNPDATDNLAVGFQVGGFVQTRSRPGQKPRTASHYFALNGRYLADTRFASRSWSLAARVTPDIPLRGNGVDFEVGKFSFRWLVSGTFDHLSNDRPGRKLDLIDAPSWTRLGFDATANVTLGLADSGHLQLRADYGQRYNLERGPGNAQRLSLRFQYFPDDHLSFGIAYDDGESFDLLTHTSVVKAVFGIRR